MDTGFYCEGIIYFGTTQKWYSHKFVDVLNDIELLGLKWLILCYMYFASIKLGGEKGGEREKCP